MRASREKDHHQNSAGSISARRELPEDKFNFNEYKSEQAEEFG